MSTIDELKPVRGPTDVGQAAMTMAVGIVVDRISRLPDADRRHLFDLAMQLKSASCEEDVAAIRDGMLEILEQHQLEIQEFAPPAGGPSEELGKWTEHIAHKVRELREKTGKTQTELAQDAGLTQSHVSRIENAELAPSHMTVEKLAAALGVDPSAIDPTR